jgi:hypothetical protein
MTVTCQVCKSRPAVANGNFVANIGLVVMRFTYRMSAAVCSRCLHLQFAKYQAINLFLGWWGVISFFATPIFIVMNGVSYGRALVAKRRLTRPA